MLILLKIYLQWRPKEQTPVFSSPHKWTSQIDLSFRLLLFFTTVIFQRRFTSFLPNVSVCHCVIIVYITAVSLCYVLTDEFLCLQYKYTHLYLFWTESYTKYWNVYLDAVVGPVTATWFPRNGSILAAPSYKELDTSRVRDGALSCFYVACHVWWLTFSFEFFVLNIPSLNLWLHSRKQGWNSGISMGYYGFLIYPFPS